MQISEVYRRGKLILIDAMSRTVDGFWISSPPYLVLDVTASPEEVGAALAQALAGSRQGVPNPPVRNAPSPIQPLLELAGVKSWNTFVKGASLVLVEQEKRSVVFKPHRNRGARQGFEEFQPETPLTVAPGDTGALGRQLLAALDRADESVQA
ncbi:hypothetical protein AB0F81_23380 [Actinoplanes sp. NPDC024001]|uniref:hypothetical protein n=1 Tax=Actinoplanes sp. NPDC024001 TaxID=3154598 RepID=UPI0033FE7C57